MFAHCPFIILILVCNAILIFPRCGAESAKTVSNITSDDISAWNPQTAPPKYNDSSSWSFDAFEKAFDAADPIIQWTFIVLLLNTAALIAILCTFCVCTYKINH
ncbi:hypothetical protein Ddc_15408 [Ditylenchus destructor]|nr:hypothetical protein Ddc_15408 [Ditylenchus destructor]